MSPSAPLTTYQACYFANDIARKRAPDDPDRITASVFDASIDLNPHQIDAALFALQSPFASGVLLADEVGLGKTVEAGLLLAQRWAEGRRRLLVVAPASLTRQWADELQDKFHLPAVVLTSANYSSRPQAATASPWAVEGVTICSYNFAADRGESLKKEFWDLVVLDEAHRLRNAYKPSNRLGNTLRDVFSDTQKVLLTATPLQNSLMELYGLMSILDGRLFGDADSFKYQYGAKRSEAALRPLADRIAPYCRRTLRRDVAAYIKWTERKAHVVSFKASAQEQALYDALGDYLAHPTLFAIPNRNRHLLALMLRKLQASSPAALAGTLKRLLATLTEEMAEDAARYRTTQVFADDCDSFSAQMDEWPEDDENAPLRCDTITDVSTWSKEEESRVLRTLTAQAEALNGCTKVDALLKALATAFSLSQAAQSRAGQQRMQPKAIIFTESRRTQDYLYLRLQEIIPEQQLVLFNGTNGSAQTREIVASWRQARAGTDLVSGDYSLDSRAAIVDYFRNHASVMIATEAAAEGLNLQFCNLVINFDLPWNPQRIEQRIGRCHRYGQRCDVVVMNFINEANAAERRVYELLDTKCRLFEGVFGASDDILGAIGSEFNFEKRIALIFDSCRTPDAIDAAFVQLQQDLDEQIKKARHAAVDKLFERFDPEVTDRVRTDAEQRRNRMGRALWQVTRYVLAGRAAFDDEAKTFCLTTLPDTAPAVPLGWYALPGHQTTADAHAYRTTHPLAQWVLSQGKQLRPDVREVAVHASPESLGAESGWCLCCLISTTGATAAEDVVVVGTSNNAWRTLMKVESAVGDAVSVPTDVMTLLRNRMNSEVRNRIGRTSNRNLQWVAKERAKLQVWARDKEIAIKKEIERLQEKADTAARDAGGDTAMAIKARVESLREEQLTGKKVVELTEQLLATRRKVSDEQGRIVMQMLKECEVEAETEELFMFRWHCVD